MGFLYNLLPTLDKRRAGKALVDGARFVFAGAAGGIAANIIATPGDTEVETAGVLVLVVMTAIIQYSLLGVDPREIE